MSIDKLKHLHEWQETVGDCVLGPALSYQCEEIGGVKMMKYKIQIDTTRLSPSQRKDVIEACAIKNKRLRDSIKADYERTHSFEIRIANILLGKATK